MGQKKNNENITKMTFFVEESMKMLAGQGKNQNH